MSWNVFLIRLRTINGTWLFRISSALIRFRIRWELNGIKGDYRWKNDMKYTWRDKSVATAARTSSGRKSAWSIAAKFRYTFLLDISSCLHWLRVFKTICNRSWEGGFDVKRELHGKHAIRYSIPARISFGILLKMRGGIARWRWIPSISQETGI